MSKQSQFEFAIDPMADLRAEAVKFAFALGVKMLVATGTPEPQARAFIGKRIKEVGKPAVMRAIMETAFTEAADPKTYLAAVTRTPAQRAAAAARDDDERNDGIQPWMT